LKIITKYFFCFIILACIFLQAEAGAYVWTQKASYPGNGLAFGTGVNVKSKLYYGTGETLGSVYSEWWEYNPATNTWARQSDFPGTKRLRACSFAISPYAFVGSGQDDLSATNTFSDFWRYDVTSDSWLQIAGMPSARTGASAFSYIDEGFVVNGDGTNGKELWKYDPVNNAWSALKNFPANGVEQSSVFAENGKAWVCCGSDGSGGTSNLWQYNIGPNTWTQKSSFPGNARWNAAAFMLDGKGTVGLGLSNGKLYNDVYQYDRFLNSWLQVDSFPGMARIGTTAFAEGDYGYICGGRDNGQYFNDLWSFGPPIDTGLIDSVPEFCSIDLTPNATKGKLYLDCDNVINKKLEFNLYDLKGRIVYSQSFNMQTKFLELNISKYREGIYIYVINCNDLFVTSGKLAIIQ